MYDGASAGEMVNQLDQLELDSTVAGSVGIPDDFIPEGALAVYDSYSFQHKYDPKLPITQRAEEVLESWCSLFVCLYGVCFARNFMSLESIWTFVSLYKELSRTTISFAHLTKVVMGI